MKYLLDTDICIYLIKNRSERLRRRLYQCEIGDVGISVITLSELIYGVEKSQWGEKNRTALAKFLNPLEVLPYEENAAFVYGSIRTELEKKGEPIGYMDLLIAAHAIALNTTLITNNVKEYKKIGRLKYESWL